MRLITVRVALRVEQRDAGHRLRVTALNAEHHIAAHRQAGPDRLRVPGVVEQGHVGVSDAIQAVRQRAVLVLTPALCRSRHRTLARTRHIRRPDRVLHELIGIAQLHERHRTTPPHAAVHREAMHQHQRNAVALTNHMVCNHRQFPCMVVRHTHLPHSVSFHTVKRLLSVNTQKSTSLLTDSPTRAPGAQSCHAHRSSAQ